MKPVGILGGTFDPVHHGHIRLAIEFLERLELVEVRLIPLNTPPHREPPVGSPAHRFKMLQIATGHLAGITVDDFELRKPSVSYTIDTVSNFRTKSGDTPVCLLMGIDAFMTIKQWHRWQELPEYVHIVIANRPGNIIDNFESFAADLGITVTESPGRLHQAPSGQVCMLNIPMLDISSTQIRSIISSGKNPEGLLPTEVINYINTHRLYKF